jgi:hypothetical protein
MLLASLLVLLLFVALFGYWILSEFMQDPITNALPWFVQTQSEERLLIYSLAHARPSANTDTEQGGTH